MAGIMSIQVLIKENSLYSISFEKRTDKKSIYQLTQQNINQNLIRNNIIYTAYLSIRNSVICLLIIFVLSIYPFQISDNSSISNIEANNGTEIIYGNDAVEWILNNPQKKPDFDKIIEAYNNLGEDGTQKNIYDKNQGIIVTVESLNDSYLFSNIINDITEIN